MAGISTVVDLLIRARDLASAPIRGIASTLRFLDSEISVVAGKIRDAFSGLFGGGLDGAIEFEAELSKVAAKGGYTAAEMEKLKQAATEIGARFGVSGTQAAAGMEALAAAGLNATQVIQALPPVLALASAEGISMDAAAEKLSDSLATVGLGFDQAARMADVLAKGANLSTTSASALAAALATAGGIAKTAGLNLEQTVAALTALANAGIKGEKAGTALQAILTQLINPASLASTQLNALGITTRDLGEVIGALASKGDASNAAILAFGEVAGPGLRALIQQGQSGVAALAGQLLDSKGAADAAASGINTNLKGALEALQSAWENVKTALFYPVLEPLAKQARELANVLTTQLASGALKPVQEAIKQFAETGIQAARDFIAGFDFNAALTAVQAFATGAKDAFTGIRDAGVTAASVVQIAWNALTAGFKTIGATLLETAASAVATLANVEEAASKIGLGSLQRANELRQTALDLQTQAGDLVAKIAEDGRDMGAAFDRLTGSADASAASIQGLTDANQRLKDGLPVAELATITRALADYQTLAERANAAAGAARADYEAGRISAGEYGRALLAAAAANAELADAIDRGADAERRTAPQRKQTAVELESIAKSAQDAADRGGKYTAALEQTASAQADAIRADIELARVKGDVATAVRKTLELAQREAEAAKAVAAAKQAEAAEQAKAVEAQKQYLAAVGGGTLAQQQELQILQLKLVAMQAEAEQAGKTAEAKRIAAQNAAVAASTTQQQTEATQQQTQATEKNSDALKENAKATDQATSSGGGLAKVLASQIQFWRDQTGALSDATRALFDFYAGFTRVDPRLGANTFGDISEEARRASTEIDELTKYVRAMGDHFATSANDVSDLFARINAAGASAKKAYFEQKLAAEELEAQIIKTGNSGGESFGEITARMKALEDTTNGAIGTFTLLNEQDLGQLRDALDRANQKLIAMQDEARSARERLAEIDIQLAEAKGQQKQADLLRQQLDYQQQLAEIEQKRQEAQDAGNRELIALLDAQARKLEELNAIKIRNINSDDRAADSTERTRQNVGRLADEAERAGRALAGISAVNLGGLVGQSSTLAGHFSKLNEVL